MTSESNIEFHQRIDSLLQKCAPDLTVINLNLLQKNQTLSMRDLAWMITICESGHSFTNIDWKSSPHRDRVDVLHNIFFTEISSDLRILMESEGFNTLDSNTRTESARKLMGIKWELTHDYNGNAIPTYWISFDDNNDRTKILIQKLLDAISNKHRLPVPELAQMMPYIKKTNIEYRTDTIIQLIGKICIEYPLKIDVNKIYDPIQSYNLAWVVVICQRNYKSISDINLQDLVSTPLVEITHKKILSWLQHCGEIHKLSPIYYNEVDLRGSESTKKIISYELAPELTLKLLNNNNEPKQSIFSNPSGKQNPEEQAQIESIIRKRFSMRLQENIKSINPEYLGMIAKKTGAPQKFILKIICIMIELDYSLSNITWDTVKEFIIENISGIAGLEQLSKLDEIDDYILRVDGVTAHKRNNQSRVSFYKREIFKI